MAILAVLGIASYALYQILTPETATVQRVDVPNVLTYTEAQARDQLESRGLQVVVVKENGEEETKGQITAQDPVAGTSVEVNSTVTITLNEGPKTAVIPDGLVGKDVDDVEKTLEDELDFTNVQTVAAKSEDPDDQTQRGGQDLTQGGVDRRLGRADHDHVRDRRVGGAELRRADRLASPGPRRPGRIRRSELHRAGERRSRRER